MGLVTESHQWKSVSLQQWQLDLRILLRPGPTGHITKTYNHPTALEVEGEDSLTALRSFTTLMHPRLAPVTSTLEYQVTRTLELVSAEQTKGDNHIL